MFQEDRLCEEYSAVKNVELVCGDRRRAAGALAELLDQEALEKPCGQLFCSPKLFPTASNIISLHSSFFCSGMPQAGCQWPPLWYCC